MPRQSKCPIPGCIFALDDEALVCWRHSLQIWEQVQRQHLESAGSAVTTESADDRAARQAEERKRRTQSSLTPGWIYFLELDEKIKVGWTSDLEQRMKAYPPHAKFILKYPGTRADERDLHRTLRLSLVAGREWYSRTPQVLNYIRDTQKALYLQYAEEAAARAQAVPAVERPKGKPRHPRGQALVRAILDGKVT